MRIACFMFWKGDGKNKTIDKIKKSDTMETNLNYVNIILGELSGGFK